MVRIIPQSSQQQQRQYRHRAKGTIRLKARDDDCTKPIASPTSLTQRRAPGKSHNLTLLQSKGSHEAFKHNSVGRGSRHLNTIAFGRGSRHLNTIAFGRGSRHLNTIAFGRGSRHLNTIAFGRGYIGVYPEIATLTYGMIIPYRGNLSREKTLRIGGKLRENIW